MLNLLLITAAQHLKVPELFVLLRTFYSASLPPAFHKWLHDFSPAHAVLVLYSEPCTYKPLKKCWKAIATSMGITPSCFCPNFLLHSFWHWQEFPTLYAQTKPQNWPAYSGCPSAKHISISINSIITRKKPPKPQEVWAYYEENHTVTMERILGDATWSTGEDTQEHIGNTLLVFMAGQCEVFPFLISLPPK